MITPTLHHLNNTTTLRPNINTQIHDDIYTVNFTSINTLKVMYMNARSIKNKQEELLHILQAIKSNIHIICITETWVKQGEEEYYGFDGYDSHFACRPSKSGGGAAILIKNDIKYELTNTFSNDENSFVAAKIQVNKKFWTVINIYRQPNYNQYKVTEFIHTLNHFLSTIETDSIVTGDFNFNTIEKNNQLTQQYLDTMLTHNLYICNTEVVTRDISRSSLDHIHTNNLRTKLQLHYVPYDILDHRLIFIENTDTTLPLIKCNARYTSRTINYTTLQNQIRNSSFQLCTTQNINNIYNDFIDHLTLCIENSTRTKRKPMKRKIKPWYDEELDKLIKKKNYWYKKKSQDPHNQYVCTEYKIARNQVTTLKRRKKQSYFQQGFTKSINNTKNTWKYIKDVIYNGTAPDRTNKIITLQNPHTFADKLNKFISEIGTRLLNNHLDQPIFIRNRTTKTYDFQEVTPSQVQHVIASLKNTASCGHDNIPTKVFKENASKLSGYIATIINKSIGTGIFPEELKITKITPIHKGGNIEDTSNYRPISILPIMDKIFEKILNHQIMEHIESNNLLYKRQYGFRHKSNTNTASFDFVNTVQRSLDQKSKVGAIFFDLKKAFETVDRKILLLKLNSYGIKGIEHKWFQSYFKDRLQYVETDIITTSLRPINAGVPQGTNLSTTLFLLFINDIKDTNFNGELFLYADDIALVNSAATIESLERNMNKDTKLIQKWIDVNKLTLNTSKSKYIIFNNNYIDNIAVTYQDIALERVLSYSYLGITIDDKLSFKPHLQKTYSNTAAITGIFRRIAIYIPEKVKRQVFFAMFHSRLTYGVMVYHTAFETQIRRLQTLQNKAIKNLFGHNNRDKISEIHETNKIPTLQQYSTYMLATHIHDIKNQNIHSNTIITFNNDKHNYNTRTSHHMSLGKTLSTRYGSNQALRRGIKIYNELPEEIKLCNRNEFRVKCKQIFMNNRF